MAHRAPWLTDGRDPLVSLSLPWHTVFYNTDSWGPVVRLVTNPVGRCNRPAYGGMGALDWGLPALGGKKAWPGGSAANPRTKDPPRFPPPPLNRGREIDEGATVVPTVGSTAGVDFMLGHCWVWLVLLGRWPTLSMGMVQTPCSGIRMGVVVPRRGRPLPGAASRCSLMPLFGHISAQDTSLMACWYPCVVLGGCG